MVHQTMDKVIWEGRSKQMSYMLKDDPDGICKRKTANWTSKSTQGTLCTQTGYYKWLFQAYATGWFASKGGN